MQIVAAFLSEKPLPAPTGGQRFNLHLMNAWKTLATVSYTEVRYRWYRLYLQVPALIFFHFHQFRQADFIFQDATAPLASAFLVQICRFLFPRQKHIGIIYHPRWMERPEVQARERALFNSFDYLITISQHISAVLKTEKILPPVRLLPPGRTKMPARMTPQVDPPLILWNGYLLERKGPLALLEALARLRSERWAAHFIISTRPSEEFSRQFDARLASLDTALQSQVRLSNHLPVEQFRAEFFKASIFCLPSLVEGYSISTAEAMACGCVAVVPRTDNFVELLGSAEYAGFYDPADPADLARKLDQLLLDSSLRQTLAVYCLERSAHLPDWEQFETLACDLLKHVEQSAANPL